MNLKLNKVEPLPEADPPPPHTHSAERYRNSCRGRKGRRVLLQKLTVSQLLKNFLTLTER
jgi:hypothetical protein